MPQDIEDWDQAERLRVALYGDDPVVPWFSGVLVRRAQVEVILADQLVQIPPMNRRLTELLNPLPEQLKLVPCAKCGTLLRATMTWWESCSRCINDTSVRIR